MCDPSSIFLATIALQGVTQGASFFQESANAKAAQKYQQQLHDSNVSLANEAALHNYAALGRRQIEERESAAVTIADVSRQATLAGGTARLSAAESGASGASVQALLQDFERQELLHTTNVIRSQAFRDMQYADEGHAIRAQQAGRQLSTLPQPVQRPNFLNAALRFGGGVIDTFNQQTHIDRGTGRWAWNYDGTSVFGD